MVMFRTSIFPILIGNWDESLVVQVPAVFGTREHIYWHELIYLTY